MYKIILSVNNNEEVHVLPYAPADFAIPLGTQNNQTYQGLSKDYRRIGTMGLRTLSWEGILPVGKKYHWMTPESSLDGWEYVNFLQRWRDRKLPFRLMVIDGNSVCRLNMPATIDEFAVQIRQSGDLAYQITVTEYRFVTGQ